MKELLAKLEKLDPECYDEIWRWALWLEEECSYENETEEHDYENHRNDVIQGACQRACAARKWELDQDSRYHGRDRAVPKNLQYRTAIIKWSGNPIQSIMVTKTSDSPAKAILACYLQAIEAQ